MTTPLVNPFETNVFCEKTVTSSVSSIPSVFRDVVSPFITNVDPLPPTQSFFDTSFQDAEGKTEKTDKNDTLTITNNDFIAGIFGDLPGNDRPIIVSFLGNPNLVDAHVWSGTPWCPAGSNHWQPFNNYISFATFFPDDNGKYRRQKKHFAALHAVLLDDIGFKVPLDKIQLQPSWKIETSSRNFQVGFILSSPITQPGEADELLGALIKSKLTDPGAGGPCTRIGRLPAATNGKHLDEMGIPFECRLAEWHPNLRYTAQEILDGLDVQIEKTKLDRPKNTSSTMAGMQILDDVYIPRADEHPIVTELKIKNLYKQSLGEGKHDITCPWVAEHTDQVDRGTAYFEPSEFYAIGGFKCMHGHCANRNLANLLDFLHLDKTQAANKPQIRVQPGKIPQICEAAEKELAKTLKHFQLCGAIVNVVDDPGTKQAVVQSLAPSGLTRAMADIAVWLRFDKRSSDRVECDPHERSMRIVHEAKTYAHLPVLNGIARQPYLRPDGSLVVQAGYDQETGMFASFKTEDFNIAYSPTQQQAQQALDELLDLLSEFSFKTDHDKSAAVAAMLTAAIRLSLPTAVMFLVKAPSIASGKSFLCELISAFATQQKSHPHSFPADDVELRKLMLAEFLTSPSVIEFDNLTSDLIPHKTLCTALTSEFISGRILSKSVTATVGTRVLFLASGNNVDPVRDMTRRTVTIALDPVCEMPASRVFNKQPVKQVRNHRAHYVSLALTIIRAWICAGRPKSVCKALASFTEWSDYCREPLLWLGLPDPAVSIFDNINHDPDRELLGLLLDAWFKKFGQKSTQIKEIIAASKETNFQNNLGNEQLQEVLTEIAGERDGSINRKRLGWWIKNRQGRVVNGLRFTKDPLARNAATWKVESLLPVSSVFTSSPLNGW